MVRSISPLYLFILIDLFLNLDKILGNAIVDVSDLMSNPSQVQNLTLNSGMSKNIFGYLVVEVGFCFVHLRLKFRDSSFLVFTDGT